MEEDAQSSPKLVEPLRKLSLPPLLLRPPLGPTHHGLLVADAVSVIMVMMINLLKIGILGITA